MFTHLKPLLKNIANIAGEEISGNAKQDIITIAEQMMHLGIEKGAYEKSIEVAKKCFLKALILFLLKR